MKNHINPWIKKKEQVFQPIRIETIQLTRIRNNESKLNHAPFINLSNNKSRLTLAKPEL